MMTGTAIFINDTSTTEIYTRSLHDALPIFFADRFGRPGKGDDKGKVEGLVGYARRNFLVPVPRVESFAALNAHLEARCRERQGARLRGHEETIGERLARDRAALLPLPADRHEARQTRGPRVTSLSL